VEPSPQAPVFLAACASRRFFGLSGYRRLIDSGVEAIAPETPPYFFPEHAKAAVEPAEWLRAMSPTGTG